jgi:hypothetical protein
VEPDMDYSRNAQLRIQMSCPDRRRREKPELGRVGPKALCQCPPRARCWVPSTARKAQSWQVKKGRPPPTLPPDPAWPPFLCHGTPTLPLLELPGLVGSQAPVLPWQEESFTNTDLLSNPCTLYQVTAAHHVLQGPGSSPPPPPP